MAKKKTIIKERLPLHSDAIKENEAGIAYALRPIEISKVRYQTGDEVELNGLQMRSAKKQKLVGNQKPSAADCTRIDAEYASKSKRGGASLRVANEMAAKEKLRADAAEKLAAELQAKLDKAK